MKKYIKYIPFLLVVFTSCEEVIEIDLQDTEPVLIIESIIEKDSTCTVNISYSTDYFDPHESEYVEDAIVTIIDNEGNEELLTNLSKGRYESFNTIGQTNKTYTVEINSLGEIYTAQSKLYSPTKITEISYLEFGMGGQMHQAGDDANFLLRFSFLNNNEPGTYYMARYIENGEMKDSYSLIPELLYSNDTISIGSMGLFFKKDTEIELRIYSIDEESYKYFSMLSDATGGNMMASSTPYNPISNFGPEVMGYFVAWSYCSKTINIE